MGLGWVCMLIVFMVFVDFTSAFRFFFFECAFYFVFFVVVLCCTW